MPTNPWSVVLHVWFSYKIVDIWFNMHTGNYWYVMPTRPQNGEVHCSGKLENEWLV